ncbi:monooxygenase [Sulfitobacter sp. SK012]|uniref:FAD-dependent monooxygenase n=1 Tax=Sulfitobacter sp. SK012 TaxID=1389005 RepID=UPI000E0A873C|nr:FAD-dependent monooxygenase [Sulfitobacter sp. SK012]AXI48899.1 monooxygenase [Sulfitobacter sp. SK012]
MKISNAIVIGAGVAGLATATALARQGIAVTVLEQADAIREIGAGLQISPNGLAVLRALGLTRVLAAYHPVTAQAVVLRAFDQPDSGPVARLDLSRYSAEHRYLFVHRADLIACLQNAARQANVSFEMNAHVARVIPGAMPTLHMDDGSTRKAELIVGADGIRSVARGVLNGADAATFSGQVAWRAVVPNSVDHPDVAQVTMGPGRHLVSYPLRGGKLVNLVAVEECKEWAAEGWMQADEPENLRAAFADFGGMPAKMLNAVRDVTLWGLHHHPVAQQWTAQGVALVGDAAHPTLPFLAQGANMALEDAWVLADCITKGLPLEIYQSRRHKRVTRVIRTAKGNARRYHLRPGPVRWAAHTGLRLGSTFAPGVMLGAFDWLYKTDVTK